MSKRTKIRVKGCMKKRRFISNVSFFEKILVIFVGLFFLSCSGAKEEFSKGSNLGPPVLDGDDTREDGNDFGQIYTVTNIYEASQNITNGGVDLASGGVAWTDAELPFTAGRNAFNITTLNKQWPFQFTYSYPPNNYKLNEARISIVTSRDSSDTEGIFIDGVMTGYVPGGNVSTTSPKVNHRHYICSGACGVAPSPGASNTYFMDWALTHYKIGAKNTFDLNILNLLAPTTVTPVDIVNDGLVQVVTGDDAAIFDNYAGYENKPLLFLEGFTISKTPLTCSNSSNFRFMNTYIHNDGNSIGQATFSGSVVTPVTSWGTAMAGFRTVEFFYDPRLPKTSSINNISLVQADLVVQVKRAVAGSSAIVINGIGIAEAGFDDSTATSAVESWETSSTAVDAWTAFVAGIPANNTTQTRTLNLLSLLGESKVKELLAQGKLNVAISGALATVSGTAATSTRTYGVAVGGPELVLRGQYFTEVCVVPNNPQSPLSDSGGAPGSCDLDEASPIASSIQVVSISATSATVQWLSNEPSDSQVGYGISSASNSSTPLDTTLSTFHSVTITGLDPYKFYQYQVRTKDNCGNQTITSTRSFRTLR